MPGTVLPRPYPTSTDLSTPSSDLRPDATDAADRPASGAHPGHGRRHGHDDPAPRSSARRTIAASGSPTGPSDLKGNNDLLSSPSPTSSAASTTQYLDAGADLVETNTFNAQRDLARRLRHGGPGLRAEPRRRAPGPREPATPRPRRPRTGRAGSLGALGPTNRTASISPDVNDPGAATSPSTSSSRPTSSRPAAWSTAAPTCCSSRRSSTPSTPRRRSSPSRRCSRRAAAAGR